MATMTIVINMDKPCVRCGKAGATDGGLCLRCVAEDIKQRLAAKKPSPDSKL